MSEIIYRQMKKEIDSAKHIALISDERIDGDTIGSTLGMYHVLKAAGKNVQVYSPKPMDPTLAFLPGTDVIQRNLSMFEDTSIDLLMVFDCADGKHLENLPVGAKQLPLIAVDHHASNPRYGTINLVEITAASTADVLWRFVKWAGWRVTREAAQCILTGVITDTNVFSTTNTTTAALEAAHELTRYGANQQQIVRETMMNKSVETLRLWGLALERLHMNSEFGVLTTVITQKDVEDIGIDETETKGLSNFLNAMTDVEATLVLKETPDGHVKGSLRSIEKNVQEIAKRYGGGGHIKAAGFLVENAHLEKKGEEWTLVKTSG